MQYARDITWNTPDSAAVEAMDRILLGLYRHIRNNSRRLAHFFVALLPLMALLVGSCETSQLPWAYTTHTPAEQLRTALFPDSIRVADANYHPAAGYISRAQSFIADQPQSLMMMTQQEISFLFGKPTLHRRDADAEVWQYKTTGCVVDFYFYGEGNARGRSNLSYIDIRTKEELIPGSAIRTTPVTPSEKSDCLKGAMKPDFISAPV